MNIPMARSPRRALCDYAGPTPFWIHTYGGVNNFFAGANAGNFSMTAGGNTAVGSSSLASDSSGSGNTGLGWRSLIDNSSGSGNTAIGQTTLFFNTSGNNNTALGSTAMQSNGSGTNNTACGVQALRYNVAIGDSALISNTNGSYNVAGGTLALSFDLSGSNNIVLGYEAGYNFTNSESRNIDIGSKGVTGESGIVRIGDTNYQTACYLAGNVYASGNFTANSVNVTSDRNAKENFKPIDPQEVLSKVPDHKCLCGGWPD
jgi:hypothetical protein